MIPTEKKVAVFMLDIIAPNKLKAINYEKSKSKESVAKRKNNQFHFKNISLKVLTKALQDFYNQRFDYKAPNNKRYNLEVEMKSDLNKTLDYLETEYGIGFSKKTTKTIIHKVVKKS